MKNIVLLTVALVIIILFVGLFYFYQENQTSNNIESEPVVLSEDDPVESSLEADNYVPKKEEFKNEEIQKDTNILEDGFHYGMIMELNIDSEEPYIVFDKVLHTGPKFGQFSNNNSLFRKLKLSNNVNFRITETVHDYGFDLNYVKNSEAAIKDVNRLVTKFDTYPLMPEVKLIYIKDGLVSDIFYDTFSDTELLYFNDYVQLIDAFELDGKEFAMLRGVYTDPESGQLKIMDDSLYVTEFEDGAIVESFYFDSFSPLSSIDKNYTPKQFINYLNELKDRDSRSTETGNYLVRFYLLEVFESEIEDGMIINLKRIE